MNVFSKFMDRWQKRVESAKALKAHTSLGVGGLFAPSASEREANNRQVRGVKLDRRFPLWSRMYWCSRGYYVGKWGYAPFSGPAPSIRAAQKAGLRNLGHEVQP